MLIMDQAVSTRIVTKVAEATNKDQVELPVLYDCIDPEALNTLVDRMSDGEVSFNYAGCEITAMSDGDIRVDERPVGDNASEASLRCD
jgi:predicted phosphoadenosine phosphosulfate sulfurtransferase